MKKDKRQIHLDPLEWRDAMRGIVTEAEKKPAAKRAKPARSSKKTKK